MGNLVSSKGLKPDQKKVEAIVGIPKPTNVPSLQRLLDKIKYLAQYILNKSTITAPLRGSLKKEVSEWNWTFEHGSTMNKLHEALTSEPVLSYYDVTKPVTIQADASQSGLGACLVQDGNPIAYVSRSMTSAEERANRKKEMLAISFATKKFHQYIYGKPSIHVQTDHKPLESILKKPMCKALPRLQRLMLMLQPYDLVVLYVPGKYMYLTNTLSRAYIEGKPETSLDEEMSRIIHSLVENTTVSVAKMEEIREASDADLTLCQVKCLILDGWPKSIKSVPVKARAYWNIRDKLHIADCVIFLVNALWFPCSCATKCYVPFTKATSAQKSARPEPELFYTGLVLAVTSSKLLQNALSA